ncbi:uncharacterized protein LOC125480256 [Pyrus x bretschneideri]|uniref:uncharacterized protein LOC125480256 n=1 Tax=Pyrus x bretschneideri TaxID=225117 RepID=UPI00202EF8CE|nr:uncharacterized protein LOC125480256 [Pyrus x bretschneideri]
MSTSCTQLRHQPAGKGPSGLRVSVSFDQGGDQLPIYDPVAELAKERSRVKFSENACMSISPLCFFYVAVLLFGFSLIQDLRDHSIRPRFLPLRPPSIITACQNSKLSIVLVLLLYNRTNDIR